MHIHGFKTYLQTPKQGRHRVTSSSLVSEEIGRGRWGKQKPSGGHQHHAPAWTSPGHTEVGTEASKGGLSHSNTLKALLKMIYKVNREDGVGILQKTPDRQAHSNH